MGDSSSCAKLFDQLKANSNYNAAKQALDSAKTANTNAAAAKVAADKAVTDALAAQGKASKGMDDAFAKCTQDEASQTKNWRMAHHMECVSSGSLTLTDNGTGSGKCPVPKMPTVTKPKMAYPVTEAECKKAGVEEDEAMDAAFAASVEEMDMEQINMPGWHHAEDGSMVKDSDEF